MGSSGLCLDSSVQTVTGSETEMNLFPEKFQHDQTLPKLAFFMAASPRGPPTQAK